MLCQESGVVDGGQREVGGHVAREVLVALVEELNGHGNGQTHHGLLGVVLGGKNTLDN